MVNGTLCKRRSFFKKGGLIPDAPEGSGACELKENTVAILDRPEKKWTAVTALQGGGGVKSCERVKGEFVKVVRDLRTSWPLLRERNRYRETLLTHEVECQGYPIIG
jgi:hypothetical protein